METVVSSLLLHEVARYGVPLQVTTDKRGQYNQPTDSSRECTGSSSRHYSTSVFCGSRLFRRSFLISGQPGRKTSQHPQQNWSTVLLSSSQESSSAPLTNQRITRFCKTCKPLSSCYSLNSCPGTRSRQSSSPKTWRSHSRFCQKKEKFYTVLHPVAGGRLVHVAVLSNRLKPVYLLAETNSPSANFLFNKKFWTRVSKYSDITSSNGVWTFLLEIYIFIVLGHTVQNPPLLTHSIAWFYHGSFPFL